MTTSTRRSRLIFAGALAAALVAGTVAAPIATAAPQTDPLARSWEAAPRPTAPQVPGYRISGYNVGKGNYRGAIDPQTGKLWLTNVSSMQKTVESSIIEVDPNTMRLTKRITVRTPSTRGKGLVSAQYDIGIPKTGDTIWTTAAQDNRVFVWNKNTGKLIKRIDGVDHAHGIVFAEGIGVAVVTTKNPGGIAMFDLKTLAPLGTAAIPRANPKKDELGAGMAVTDSSAAGATITAPSYYSSMAQFRITRPGGGKVVTKLNWVARQGNEGHGNVEADAARNRFYVNNLYAGTVSAYSLSTGRKINDVFVGPGVNSLLLDKRRGTLYAANFWGGYITAINQRTSATTQLLTTGLLPNQLLAWKPGTFLVIDKSSVVLDDSYTQNRGHDRVWKVTSVR